MPRTPDIPIACTLPADQLQRRLEEVDAIARDALRSRRPISGGARMTFDDGPGVRGRLERFIAAEAECCPFLTMTLRPDRDSLVLDVTGSPAAAPMIEALFAADAS